MNPNIPDKIYLQIWDEDGEPSHWPTWCVDRVHDTDVLYVRIVDIAPTPWADAMKERIEIEYGDVAERLRELVSMGVEKPVKKPAMGTLGYDEGATWD